MGVRSLPLRLVAAAALLGAPATGIASSASERLVGVVAPTVGATVDAQGAFTGAGGTQRATVTREQRGSTVVVTVTPTL